MLWECSPLTLLSPAPNTSEERNHRQHLGPYSLVDHQTVSMAPAAVHTGRISCSCWRRRRCSLLAAGRATSALPRTASAMSLEAGFAASGQSEDHRAVVGCTWYWIRLSSWHEHLRKLASCAISRHNMLPPASWQYLRIYSPGGGTVGYLKHQQQMTFDLWTLKLASESRVTWATYLCANFSLPRPPCSRVRPDVRDRRQTSDSMIA